MRNIWIAAALAPMGCGSLTFLGKVDQDASVPQAVQAAFDESCATADCHGSPFPPAGLDLTAAQSGTIVDRASSEKPELPLVEIGNLQGSYMALKLLPEERRDGFEIDGERMPIDGDHESEDIAIILGWIAGAELPAGIPEVVEPTTTDTDTTGQLPAEVNDCSLWGATAAETSPVVYGEEAGQIPSVPGHIIEANCGCHTVAPDELEDWVTVPPDNGFRANTLADWQVLIFGVPPAQIAAQRVELHNMPPPIQCGVRSSGGAMNAGDYELLLSWLQAGAPDAPTWNATR